MCSSFLLEDVSGDSQQRFAHPRIRQPIAEAVFARGQTPAEAKPGDIVENDLGTVLKTISDGWNTNDAPLALLILDLCFHTGVVTLESHSKTHGMPAGVASDRSPGSYFGLQILDAVRERFPDLPIVIMSARDKDAVSREYTRRGAIGFLSPAEPDGPNRLAALLEADGLIPDSAGQIIGCSKPLLLALRSARRVSGVNGNILIRGERGSGKELFARLIHNHTPNGAARPIETVDSGSLQSSLFASELFGHEKGAFTGAHLAREGLIRRANGGDIFLDEIGNMPLDIQTGLLRVIEQRKVVPLGANSGMQVKVRFLSATNEDLESASLAGRFRNDLFDRLKEAGTVVLPPLRDRQSDLPILTEFFLRQAESTVPNATRRQIDPETHAKIASYDWPGNIRELRSCLFVAVLNYAAVEHLMPHHLHMPKPGSGPPRGIRPASIATTEPSETLSQTSDEEIPLNQLAGILPKVQAAHKLRILRLLKIALMATRRRSLDYPDGDILIQPAMRLLCGSKTLTASQAADLIKRIFANVEGVPSDLLSDPVLTSAIEIAKRLRPSSPIKANKHPK